MSMQSEPSGDAALAALARAPADTPLVLLHSGRHENRWATRSILAQPAAWFTHTPGGRSALTDLAGRPHAASADLTHRPWRDLRMLLHHPACQPGRWVGYFSYDLARVIEPGKLAPPRADAWPLIQLAWCPHVREWPAPPAGTQPTGDPDARAAGVTLTPDFTRRGYEAAVRRCIDYIAAGDVFQVNLAQRFTGACAVHPRELFARLAAVGPAWYGAYLELPTGSGGGGIPGVDRAILSTSPELFLQVDRGHVITRPIKGTRPAHTPVAELVDSAKDAAELHMIVDLLRNDLGKVCSYGSVRVTEPRGIESHPTVHHGVATIEGDLHESRDIVDLLRAALPGGSITGAPKVRAMQIIDELEPVPRGPYCGSIGWITRDACQLNIAIRTMCVTGPPRAARDKPEYGLSFHVGGGIVADSDPAAEYHETLDKAAVMLTALGAGLPGLTRS